MSVGASVFLAATMLITPATMAQAATSPETLGAQWTAAGNRAELASEQLDAAQAAAATAARAQQVAAARVSSSARGIAPAQRTADLAAAAVLAGRRALSPVQAAVAADTAQLASYAAAAYEGGVPSNLQLLMSASSSQNLLDQQQAINSVAVSHDRVLQRSKVDLRELAASQTLLEQRVRAASGAAAAAVAAHTAAMSARSAAQQANVDAVAAARTAHLRKRAADAQVARFHALYDQLSVAQRAAGAAAGQSVAQSSAFVRRYNSVVLRAGAESLPGLTESQSAIARQIAGVAVARGLGERGALIGIMTAITESTLTNVDHGDDSGPSSIGVFQQMTDWGSLAQRTDPAQAAGLFFDRLVAVPDWRNLPPWTAAQAVQESEFSDGSNYEAALDEAQTITTAVLVTATPGGDSNSAPVSAPSPQAQLAVDYALAQIGKRFVYGASGPAAFDSSGLTSAAWGQAGVIIPRASFQQATLRTVPMTQLQPGDLITSNVPISHVDIYVGDGMVVSAASEAQGIVQEPVGRIGPHPTAHRVDP